MVSIKVDINSTNVVSVTGDARDVLAELTIVQKLLTDEVVIVVNDMTSKEGEDVR